MVVGIINTNGTMNQSDIADYIAANIKDPISRTPAAWVTVQLFGAQYAMRIWMDPNKLNNFQLTPVDVISALQAQNTQVRSGSVGRHSTSERSAVERLNRGTDSSD